jgi:hypothetical protein
MARSIFALLLLLLGVSSRALAQQSAPVSEEPSAEAEALEHPAYREAFQAGVEAFDRRSYREARERFTQAHALWSNARTWRVLGYCAFELAEYPSAIELLERALASQERPLTDAQRTETEDVLRRARGYVTAVTLLTTPADARVDVDGVQIALDPEHVARLAVGPHAIDVRAPDYYPAQRQIEVIAGTPQTVQIELTALPAPPSPVQHAPRSDAEPLRKNRWLWAGVATVAAVALVTGLAVGLHDPGTRSATGGEAHVTIPAGGMKGMQP